MKKIIIGLVALSFLNICYASDFSVSIKNTTKTQIYQKSDMVSCMSSLTPSSTILPGADGSYINGTYASDCPGSGNEPKFKIYLCTDSTCSGSAAFAVITYIGDEGGPYLKSCQSSVDHAVASCLVENSSNYGSNLITVRSTKE